MKKFLVLISLILIISCQKKQAISDAIVTSDIDNFWTAYDSIISTQDSIKQVKYLKDLYLNKGTEGLEKMISARNYSVEEYLYVINSLPKYWASIRPNTHIAKELKDELQLGIEGLKQIYPQLKPAKIYFTIGALRSNGTTMDDAVLIGSELAFGNKSTPTDELPDYLSHLPSFFQSEPSKNIVFLNIHEYIHTQQRTTIGDNLLAQTVLEGVAEFLTEKALNQPSPNPQIQYGRENDERIKAKYELEMFSPVVYNWIWNSENNDFGMRDLAYYVGYKVCEEYYKKATDKTLAIKEMIELDYNNEKELIAFVEASGYFEKPLMHYKKLFNENRPRVVGLKNIDNNSLSVNPETDTLTIEFSDEMDERFRNFQIGNLGENHLIRIKSVVGFSENGKILTLNIEKLESNKEYQIIVGQGFRNMDGLPLEPYLISFKTE